VYCLVCTASCALTSAAGLARQWFGTPQLSDAMSSTTVIGSLLTGIGFLGAGIIVKSGASGRDLTTPASICSSAAVGILVGVHFVAAAVGLTAIFIVCMATVPRLERHLPGKAAIAVRLRYREGARPHTDKILSFLGEGSLMPHSDSASVTFDGGRFGLELIVSGSKNKWRFIPARPWRGGTYASCTRDPTANLPFGQFEAVAASWVRCEEGTVHALRPLGRFDRPDFRMDQSSRNVTPVPSGPTTSGLTQAEPHSGTKTPKENCAKNGASSR